MKNNNLTLARHVYITKIDSERLGNGQDRHTITLSNGLEVALFAITPGDADKIRGGFFKPKKYKLALIEE